MYLFHVNDTTYKVKFGYGVLYQSDLIDRVLTAMQGTENDVSASVRNLIGLTAELLLAGLQKYHADEFGYEFGDEETRRVKLMKVCNMIDDYEDEHADDDEPLTGFSLFVDLQGELERNGFLSRLMSEMQKTASDQNATKVPTDHRRKSKAGASK